MAFLCPVRIRRGKKKKPIGSDIDKDLSSSLGLNHGMGRITGSASIETLVRVGIEKEHGLSPDSKMVVLHDFTPCVDDELEVKSGQIVNILYRENDWVYVIGQDTRQEGFIPHSTVAGLVGLTGSLKHSQASLSSEPDFLPFSKDPSGRYIVLYTFIARDENDVSVERGEFVTVLNREDPEWYWIVRSDGQEGFIPSGFVYPAENILQGQTKLNMTGGGPPGNNNNNNNNVNVGANDPNAANMTNMNGGGGVNNLGGNGVVGGMNPSQPQQPGIGSDDLRYHGTELVMLYDYKAQAPDDLSVRRGDWIYADLNNQTVDGWLWAYAPKTRKYGFIPKAYARPQP
ncbi:hypothetical protein quinque_003518 [Culex quinquefasciatus]